MKVNWNVNILRRLTLALAAVAVGLRYLMYATAVDEKGLLTAWNWPGVLLAATTVGAVALAIIGCRKLTEEGNPADVIPGWVWGCALALGIVTMLLTETPRGDNLAKIRIWLGWASVPCLLAVTFGLHLGKRPAFLLHAVVCLFFGLYLVDHYRVWSGQPQLMDYVFQLFGCVGLLLTAYQRTAFDVGAGNGRALRITELLAAFACLAGATDSGQALFYVAGGMWCLAGPHAPAVQEVVDDESA